MIKRSQRWTFRLNWSHFHEPLLQWKSAFTPTQIFSSQVLIGVTTSFTNDCNFNHEDEGVQQVQQSLIAQLQMMLVPGLYLRNNKTPEDVFLVSLSSLQSAESRSAQFEIFKITSRAIGLCMSRTQPTLVQTQLEVFCSLSLPLFFSCFPVT